MNKLLHAKGETKSAEGVKIRSEIVVKVLKK